jgi:hypothetical protein
MPPGKAASIGGARSGGEDVPVRLLVVVVLLGAGALWLRDPTYPRGHDREGLLVAEAALPVYADDGAHALNRLHQALFITALVPDEVGAALPAERRMAGGDDAVFFAPKWYFGKRKGTAGDAAVFGGEVRFSPVSELRDARAERVRALLAGLQRKEQVAAVAELRAPLMRLLLQWDLLTLWWRCERDQTADDATLAVMARAIAALALERSALALLDPGIDALRAAVATGSDPVEPVPMNPYFPNDLLASPTEFVEVDRDDKALFHAERSLRAVRVFVRVPDGAGATRTLVAACATAGKDGALPPIPLGTDVALVLSLLAIDADLQPFATPVTDEVRIRRLQGEAKLAPDNGSSRDGVSHWVWLRTRALSRDPRAAHAFRFVPDSQQALFLEYGTRKHTTYYAQCALCHRLTDTGKQTPSGITSLGRFSHARVCTDPATRLRRAEQQAGEIGARLRTRLRR